MNEIVPSGLGIRVRLFTIPFDRPHQLGEGSQGTKKKEYGYTVGDQSQYDLSIYG
ncbi:hypothetical protein NWP22_03505 [Anabaenopsis tanganyikae CS-531]|uniref:Uncharacterized protein n=2 Tax=Anabaenopsis TaxID=110103 RepID=A0ABT5ALJ5_9CYAN|nr:MULTISPECIES: hypothetical protein [Anabaenopsis]MDB9538167.1 hypothetical protein [Anabaenopsis arnoldii]MDH6092478.1 hypothetical protein [Anabaenopsis arnoldii]MDH6104949.1 hypothetical protein [Anabaenopsis tanganyikae CS-531]